MILKLTKYLILSIVISISLNRVNAQEIYSGINYEKELVNDLNAELELQFRNELGAYSDHYAILQGGLDYDFTKRISAGCTFRYTSGKEVSEEGKDHFNKYRFTTDFKMKTKRFDNDLKFSNRVRYQYTVKDEKQKNMIRDKIECNYRLTKKVDSYIALEPYYSINKNQLKVIRFYLGSEFELLKNEIEVFVIIENNIDNRLVTSNPILGFTYKF